MTTKAEPISLAVLGDRTNAICRKLRAIGWLRDNDSDFGNSYGDYGDAEQVGELLKALAHEIRRFGEVASDAVRIGDSPEFEWHYISECGADHISIDAAILAEGEKKRAVSNG